MGIAYVVISFIRIYQLTLSPDKGLLSFFLKGKICCHEPHCSKYSIKILKRYWFTNGIFKVFDRVSRCTWSKEKIYDPEYYKVVFFSGAQIGIPFLKALHEDKRFEVNGVVTMPDKPRGRGMRLQENIIKQEATKIRNKEDPSSKKVLLYECSGKEIINAMELSDKRAREDKTPDAFIKNVKAIILDKDGCALSIFREDYQQWELPWWSVENGENLEDTLSREIQEELWVQIVKSELIRIRKRISWVKACSYYYIVQVKGEPSLQENNKHSKLIYHKVKSIEFEWKYLDRMLKQEKDKIHDRSTYTFQLPKIEEIILEKQYCQYFDLQKYLYTIEPSNKEQEDHLEEFCVTPRKLNPDKSEEWKQFVSRLKQKKPDFLVVIAYGKIIPQAILDIPNIAPINVHGSLLPTYRGASPIQSVFLDKKQNSGITIMKMDASMDTGAMIDKLKTRLEFHRTAKDLINRIMDKWPNFLTKTLRNYGKWLLWEVKQPDKDATYCSKIEKEDWEINPFKDSVSDVYAKYRAFAMRPKIHFFLDDSFGKHKGKRVVIEELILDEELFLNSSDSKLISENMKLHKAVKSLIVKPEGKKKIGREDFLKGYLK